MAEEVPGDAGKSAADLGNVNPVRRELRWSLALADDTGRAHFHGLWDESMPVGLLALNGEKKTPRADLPRIVSDGTDDGFSNGADLKGRHTLEEVS